MAVTTIAQPEGSYLKIETIKGPKRLGTVAIGEVATTIIAESADRVTCFFRNLGPDPITVARTAEDLADPETSWALALGESVTDIDSTDAWLGICAEGDTASVQWMYVNQGDA